MIGLPSLPHITFTPAPAWDTGYTRKLPDVIAFAGDRPLAWIDDGFGTDEKQWATARREAGIPTLLLATDGRIGLMEAHVE